MMLMVLMMMVIIVSMMIKVLMIIFQVQLIGLPTWVWHKSGLDHLLAHYSTSDHYSDNDDNVDDDDDDDDDADDDNDDDDDNYDDDDEGNDINWLLSGYIYAAIWSNISVQCSIFRCWDLSYFSRGHIFADLRKASAKFGIHTFSILMYLYSFSVPSPYSEAVSTLTR